MQRVAPAGGLAGRAMQGPAPSRSVPARAGDRDTLTQGGSVGLSWVASGPTSSPPHLACSSRFRCGRAFSSVASSFAPSFASSCAEGPFGGRTVSVSEDGTETALGCPCLSHKL